MVELIGDICQPSSLTIPSEAAAGMSGYPVVHTGGTVISGNIILSGTKLVYWNGTEWEKITSDATL
jgi:hypothetical protein